MKKTGRTKKDPIEKILKELPSQGTFEEVKTAFNKFGTTLTPEQEKRLLEILKKKRK